MNITPFQFDTSITIRTVTNDGDVLFVARDVAVALGYADTSQAIRDNCKRAKSLKDMDPSAGLVHANQALTLDPKTKLIPESDVYRLVMRSKLPSAERFQDWVVEEVLPTLRKTGKYSAEPEYKIPQTYLEALEAHLEALKRVEVLEHQIEEQETVIETLEPKAQFHDEVADATGLMSMGEAAARLHIGTITLFKVLRAKGILMKTDKYNTPYQTYRSAGYFVVKTSKFRGHDGMTHLSHTTYVTPKGLTFLFKQLQNW